MTGEMQDDSWIARRWTLILAIAVMFADMNAMPRTVPTDFPHIGRAIRVN
jgi:hypothetical protein